MMDKLFKIFLVFVAVYFLAHIGCALAQPMPSPTVPAPIVQCWSNGMGTIQCIQI